MLIEQKEIIIVSIIKNWESVKEDDVIIRKNKIKWWNVVLRED